MTSRSRSTAWSMTDFSSGTALAKMIECSSAAASVPSYTTACSCSDALLRSFACRLLQKEQSAVVRATSSSTAAVVWVSDARQSSAPAARFAALDAGPQLQWDPNDEKGPWAMAAKEEAAGGSPTGAVSLT